MTKHSPEPWGIDEKYTSVIIDVLNSPVLINDESEANQARLVACVNACAGMDDPEKEIAEMRARLEIYLGPLRGSGNIGGSTK